MSVITRDQLSSDIGPAVRLLEECRSLPNTRASVTTEIRQRFSEEADRFARV